LQNNTHMITGEQRVARAEESFNDEEFASLSSLNCKSKTLT